MRSTTASLPVSLKPFLSMLSDYEEKPGFAIQKDELLKVSTSHHEHEHEEANSESKRFLDLLENPALLDW